MKQYIIYNSRTQRVLMATDKWTEELNALKNSDDIPTSMIYTNSKDKVTGLELAYIIRANSVKVII